MIYFILCKAKSDERYIKIGHTNGEPKHRLQRARTDNPFPLELIGVIPGDAGMEREIQAHFSKDHVRGEWYKETQELINFIETEHKWYQGFWENIEYWETVLGLEVA